jgi:hypothetical protein
MQRTLIAITLMALAGGICLQAQSFAVRATVPFDFTVGASTLPAGDYIIDRAQPSVLRVRAENGTGKGVLTLANAAYRDDRKAGSGKLVFNRIGDAYFLEKVWVPGDSIGAQLPKGAVEKELLTRARYSGTVTVALQ